MTKHLALKWQHWKELHMAKHWFFQANNVFGFTYPPPYIFHCTEVTLHMGQGSVRLWGKARRYF